MGATIYASIQCRMHRTKTPKKSSESKFNRNIPMGEMTQNKMVLETTKERGNS
jgi:hypothetical protein